jgi:CubicO group peptidase (beta-lactamase class C family)
VAAGIEEAGTSRAITDRSSFPFGSVTKVVTATVVMQLAADGDIDLDVPIVQYLPELATAAWRDATARQLLSHSGGLVSGHEVAGESVSARRYVLGCLDEPLVAPPGAAFSYSNTGYVVLGRLVESVTGYTWREAADWFLAGPLGIELSYVDDPVWTSVRAHAVNGTAIVPLDADLPAGWGPAGGVAGTAGDLAALARLLMDDTPPGVLDAGAAAEMRAGVPGLEPFGLAEGWGLGLAVYGGGWAGHDGTLDGTSAHLRFHPESGTIVALTTNASSGPAMWAELWSRLEPVVTAESGPPELGRVPDVGAYLADDYRNGSMRFEVRVDSSGDLQLRDHSGFTATLRPSRPDVFTVHRADTEEPTQLCRFVRDELGAVAALQFSGRLAVRTGVR